MTNSSFSIPSLAHDDESTSKQFRQGMSFRDQARHFLFIGLALAFPFFKHGNFAHHRLSFVFMSNFVCNAFKAVQCFSVFIRNAMRNKQWRAFFHFSISYRNPPFRTSIHTGSRWIPRWVRPLSTLNALEPARRWTTIRTVTHRGIRRGGESRLVTVPVYDWALLRTNPIFSLKLNAIELS